MAAPLARSPTRIEVEGGRLVSESYVEMTVQLMRQFGAQVEIERTDTTFAYVVQNKAYSNPPEFFVEPDASSATYPLGRTALPHSPSLISFLSSFFASYLSFFPFLIHGFLSVSSSLPTYPFPPCKYFTSTMRSFYLKLCLIIFLFPMASLWTSRCQLSGRGDPRVRGAGNEYGERVVARGRSVPLPPHTDGCGSRADPVDYYSTARKEGCRGSQPISHISSPRLHSLIFASLACLTCTSGASSLFLWRIEF